MTVSNPADYRDKSLDWNEHFDRNRRVEIHGLLTDAVIAEHEANPLGYRKPHSPALQKILNYFRTAPILGKYFIYTSEPWHEYRIGIVTERGKAAVILDEPVFSSEEEAMHGVFSKRVEDLRAALR